MKNPVKDEKDSGRVIRGGSWIDGPGYLRVSSRSGGDPADRGNYQGFRIVRNSNEKSSK